MGGSIKKENISNIIVGIIIFLIGIGVLIGSYFAFRNEIYYVRKGIKVDAVIIEIEHIEIHNGSSFEGSEDVYNVYVEYYVDGVQHYGKLPLYAGMYEGKIISIRYLPENPGKIKYGTPEYPLCIFLAIMGLGTSGFGLALIITTYTKHKKQNRIRNQGYTMQK